MLHDPAALAPLRDFRQQLYGTVLGRRQDSLFELSDAVLTADGPRPVVRLSLQPAFRRRWPSASDALADGCLDPAALRRLCVGSLPAPAAGQRELWAAAGTSYPRADAATSPERTLERRAVAGARQAPIVPAWEYQWLVALPEPGTSWVLPLEVRRRGPTVGTPTALLLRQLRAALAQRPPTAPRPVVLLDSGYSAGELAQASHAGLGADLLVRLAKRRTLARAPGPYCGRGARPKHGPAFRTHDPRTHGHPQRTATTTDQPHGTITVELWEQLHDPAAAAAPFAVARVTLERLAGGAPPPRATVAGLDRSRAAGRLAGPVALVRRPLHHRARLPLPQTGPGVDHLPPARCHRHRPLDGAAGGRPVAAVAGAAPGHRRAPALGAAPAPGRQNPWPRAPRLRRLLPTLGSPTRPPKPRGNAPGRQPGQRPPPANRHPVCYRPKPDRPCRCPSHRSRLSPVA